MCFSAAASFSLSAVLAGIGAGAISRDESRSWRELTVIPLLFAAQQAVEGVVWLTIGRPDVVLLHRVSVNAFLGFALVVWPLWIPYSFRRAERQLERRRFLSGILGIGVAVSIGAIVLLEQWQPQALIVGHSISYRSAAITAARQLIVLALYVVPTIGPFFLSTIPGARTIGVTLVVALMSTVLIQREALTSVWCFFAALISAMVFVTVGQLQTARGAAVAGR